MKKNKCPKYLQIYLVGLLKASLISCCVSLFPSATYGEGLSLWQLSPLCPLPSRGPNSYATDDQIVSVPLRKIHWVEQLLAEDNKGVMVGMREEVNRWIETEDYLENWNLTSTNMIILPTEREKERFLRKKFLRYIDKRLSGEIKEAEEGSTLATVGKVQDALKPNSNISLAKDYRLRFKGRVLQGEGRMKFENPFAETEAKLRLNGDLNVRVTRSIASIGLSSYIDFDFDDNTYTTRMDQKLTETIEASIFSTQKIKQDAFSKNSDQVFQVQYSAPF